MAVYQEDAPLYERAFGYRDIQNQLPNLPETRFGIASGTKFFTALGIGRLIDQGRLELGTEVGELSPAYADLSTRAPLSSIY
ncbi:MAG: serine hydrolase [bacterium]|nr:serine hydrolase [bacterium]